MCKKVAFEKTFKLLFLLFVDNFSSSFGNKSLGFQSLDLKIDPVFYDAFIVTELKKSVSSGTDLGGGGLLVCRKEIVKA